MSFTHLAEIKSWRKTFSGRFFQKVFSLGQKGENHKDQGTEFCMKLLQNRVLKTAISTQLGGSLMIVIEALPQFPFLSNFNEKSLGKRKNELPFPFLSAHYSKTRFFVQYLFVLWEAIPILRIVSCNGLKRPHRALIGLKWPQMAINSLK